MPATGLQAVLSCSGYFAALLAFADQAQPSGPAHTGAAGPHAVHGSIASSSGAHGIHANGSVSAVAPLQVLEFEIESGSSELQLCTSAGGASVTPAAHAAAAAAAVAGSATPAGHSAHAAWPAAAVAATPRSTGIRAAGVGGGITADAVEAVIRYLYGLPVTVTQHSARALLVTSTFFDVTPLAGQVSDYVFSTLSTSNVVDYMLMVTGRDYGDAGKLVEDASLAFLYRNAVDVGANLARLPLPLLKKLLTATELYTANEFQRYKLVHLLKRQCIANLQAEIRAAATATAHRLALLGSPSIGIHAPAGGGAGGNSAAASGGGKVGGARASLDLPTGHGGRASRVTTSTSINASMSSLLGGGWTAGTQRRGGTTSSRGGGRMPDVAAVPTLTPTPLYELSSVASSSGEAEEDAVQQATEAAVVRRVRAVLPSSDDSQQDADAGGGAERRAGAMIDVSEEDVAPRSGALSSLLSARQARGVESASGSGQSAAAGSSGGGFRVSAVHAAESVTATLVSAAQSLLQHVGLRPQRMEADDGDSSEDMQTGTAEAWRTAAAPTDAAGSTENADMMALVPTPISVAPSAAPQRRVYPSAASSEGDAALPGVLPGVGGRAPSPQGPHSIFSPTHPEAARARAAQRRGSRHGPSSAQAVPGSGGLQLGNTAPLPGAVQPSGGEWTAADQHQQVAHQQAHTALGGKREDTLLPSSPSWKPTPAQGAGPAQLGDTEVLSDCEDAMPAAARPATEPAPRDFAAELEEIYTAFEEIMSQIRFIHFTPDQLAEARDDGELSTAAMAEVTAAATRMREKMQRASAFNVRRLSELNDIEDEEAVPVWMREYTWPAMRFGVELQGVFSDAMTPGAAAAGGDASDARTMSSERVFFAGSLWCLEIKRYISAEEGGEYVAVYLRRRSMRTYSGPQHEGVWDDAQRERITLAFSIRLCGAPGAPTSNSVCGRSVMGKAFGIDSEQSWGWDQYLSKSTLADGNWADSSLRFVVNLEML